MINETKANVKAICVIFSPGMAIVRQRTM